MGGLESLINLAGQWQGNGKLWLPPDNLYESQSTATIAPAIRGKFVRIDYTWTFEGEPQEGLMLFGYEAQEDVVTAAWADSWHMGDKLMSCRGTAGEDGTIDVRGSYSVPNHPDWGWRMTIEPKGDDVFRVLMYNVTPEGEEMLGVELSYNKYPSVAP